MTKTTQPHPAAQPSNAGSRNPASELVHISVFEPAYSETTPLSIVADLDPSALHRVEIPNRSFPLEKFLARVPRKIQRTDSHLNGDGSLSCKFVLVKSRGGSFVVWGQRILHVYSPTQRAAHRIARLLQRIVSDEDKESRRIGYMLIKRAMVEIETEFVALSDSTVPARAELDFLYGNGMTQWHRAFTEKFIHRQSGITIMEGPPGCGKTSYIRSLIADLADSHSFYFIAPQDLRMLTEPEFVTFWSAQRTRQTGRRLTLIVEDAERALRPRGDDNQSLVSTLLNFADGLLSDFMQLQIICSINCKSTELDPALLRPGRLLAHRIFGRLSAKEARSLAESRGISLRSNQADYSLAEIFNDPVDQPRRGQTLIGFAT